MPSGAFQWPDPSSGRGDVRQLLAGQRYESAAHVVVCEADTFLGILTIGDLLFAAADAQMESLIDQAADGGAIMRNGGRRLLHTRNPRYTRVATERPQQWECAW